MAPTLQVARISNAIEGSVINEALEDQRSTTPLARKRGHQDDKNEAAA
jgi:hypothetical protein